MRFANEFDIERFIVTAEHRANRYGLTHGDYSIEAAGALLHLAEWTNQNSDGWAYWPKPCRSAARLIELLEDWEREYRKGGDAKISKADLTKALTPIKAFLTRQGVSHDILKVEITLNGEAVVR